MKKALTAVLLLSVLLATFSFLLPVSANTAATLKTDKTTYTEGEPILVTASSKNESGKDWVGITVKGDKTGASIRWDYLSDITANYDIKKATQLGKNRGTLYDLPAGEYTVFLMPNDLSVKSGYDQILAMVDITIKPDANKPESTAPSGDTYIKADKTSYVVGEPIYVTASSKNESGKDWIGIWPKGEMGASIYWEYLNDVGKGKPFDIRHTSHSGASRSAYFGIPVGEYTLYLIPNDLTGTNGIPVALGSVDITVKNDPNRIAKAPLSATYKLKNDTDGMADGTLTIKLPEDHGADDIYMWWGNDSGKLPGYTRLARFKVTGTTITHQMTANTLIPEGATKLMIYTYNESNGISKDCIEVKLPAGAASKDLGKVLSEFQVVSDIHIRSAAADDEYSKHFIGMLEDVVKNSPNSVGIFAAGDNVDRGDKPEYWTYFNKYYTSVKGAPPMYLGIGNHEYIGTDYKNGLTQFLKNVKLPGEDAPTKSYYDCWVNGYHYVFIGSDQTGSSYLGKDQLAWLEETLAENRDGRPIFLFHHQPMLNTVSGSSSAEGWSGIGNHKQLKAVLDKFPEVMMFNGHTHWILDSDNCMYDGQGKTASIFNTSSVAYLWHSYNIPKGERQTGSEGYYIRIYEDKVALLGRNFETGEWVSSAQFIVNYTAAKTEETTPAPETTAAPVVTTAPPAETTVPAEPTTQAPAAEPASGSPILPIAIAAVVVVAAAAVGVLLRKKRKAG